MLPSTRDDEVASGKDDDSTDGSDDELQTRRGVINESRTDAHGTGQREDAEQDYGDEVYSNSYHPYSPKKVLVLRCPDS